MKRSSLARWKVPVSVVGGAIVMMSGGRVARADLLDMPQINVKSEAVLREGWIAYRAGDLLSLPGKINSALQLAQDAKDVPGQASILLIKSTLARLTMRTERADELEAQANEILKQLPAREQLSLFFGAGLALREAGATALGQTWIERGATQAQASGDVRSRAQALHLQGLFAWETDQQKAKSLWQEALPLWEKCGDKAGMAWTFLRLGMVARNESDGRNELRLLSQAREWAAKGDKSDIQARAASELMVFYLSNGDLARAHDFGVEALGFSEKATDPLMETQRSLVLQQLALIASRGNKFEDVTKYGKEGRDLAHSLGRKRAEANLLATLASARLNLGQLDLAQQDVEDGLAITQANGWPDAASSGSAQSLRTTAFFVYLAQGKREQALQINDQLPDNAASFAAKAVAAELRGDLNGAIEKWTQCLGDAEWRRSRLGDITSAKIGFVADRRQDYGRLIDLLLRQNRVEEAFAWVEKARGRGLLDVMDGGRAGGEKHLSPAQKAGRAKLFAALSNANARLLALQMNEGADTNRVDKAKEEAGAASRELESFLDQIAAANPSLAATAQTFSLADVGKTLPEDTALVEFAFVDGGQYPTPVHRLVAFVARSDGEKATMQAVTIDTNREELSELVGDFAGACADPRKSFKSKARELDRLLLEPLRDSLGNAKRLLICPEGPLWGAPFAAFMDSKSQFAVQRWEIVLGFGATAALRVPAANEKGRATQEMLVVANPTFGGPTRLTNSGTDVRALLANSRGLTANSRALTSNSRALTANSRGADGEDASGILTREGAIKPLPGTGREAKAIAADFPGAQVLEGQGASESAARELIGHHRFVHFATHGLFNDTDPLGSSLVLAAPLANSGDDGFLTAREILDLDLNADLVVLSACNTGQGEKRDGEGVLGLTWALAASGARAQVVSGWAVDDDSTARLMSLFYGRLKTKEARGASLRGAMIALQTEPKHAHPFYWAPFFLIGDWK